MQNTISAILMVLAGTALAEEKTPEQWVAEIKVEANTEQPSEEIQTLRLAAGVYVSNHTGRDTVDHPELKFPDSARRLLAFMNGRGKVILGKLRSEQALTAEEEPYRLVVLGCWLKAGHDLAGKSKAHELYLHPILLSDEKAKQQSVKFYRQVIEQGLRTLTKGYVERQLSAEDIDRIRLYRMAKGMQWGEDAFLPSSLGIHELRATGRSYGGHGEQRDIQAARIGKSMLPMRLATLEGVRARATYDDAPMNAYGFRYPFLPEGVLEFLEPMTGYVPGKAVNGNPAVFIKPEFQTSPPRTEGLPKELLLSDMLVGKPVLLFVNDATDCALEAHIHGVPTILKAWEDRINWSYIQVNIHDTYYASGLFHDYLLNQPGRHPQHHAWSEEERARRIGMRLVQNPQNDNTPVLIDTNYQHFKDLYASCGGSTKYWLFDSKGTARLMVCHTRLLVPTINMMEFGLSQLVASDGKGRLDLPHTASDPDRRIGADVRALVEGKGSTALWAEPLTYCPEDPILILKDGVVSEVSAAGFKVKIMLADGERTISCRLTSRARVMVDGAVRPSAGLGGLKPGMHVIAKCRFSDLGFKGELEWPKYTYNWSTAPKPTNRLFFEGLTVTAEQLSNDYDSDTWDMTPVAIDGNGVFPVRWVKASEKEWARDILAEIIPPSDMIWRGGIVQHVDRAKQTISVRPWPYNQEKLDGRHILKQWQDEGREIYLSDIAKARHACVTRWLADEGKDETFYCDDAVVYTLNGLYVADFNDIEVGDRITVRYRVDDDTASVIPASMVRISRCKKNN